MSSDDDSRQIGVEFGSLEDELETVDYPITKEELLAEYGSSEIELEDENQTLQEILGPMGEDEFTDAAEVQNTVMTMVGDDAVGREDYSDRSDELNEEERESESI